MKKALQYINNGHKKADSGLNVRDMMQIEDGQNSAILGAKWWNEAIEERDKITPEKDKIENEQFKLKKVKKSKV